MPVDYRRIFLISFAVGFVLGMAFGGLFGLFFGLGAGVTLGVILGLTVGVSAGILGVVLSFVWRELPRNSQLILIVALFLIFTFVPGLEALDIIPIVGAILTFSGVSKKGR